MDDAQHQPDDQDVRALQYEQIAWGGWGNCYRLTDGTVEMIVTADVGPRIIHFGFVGGENVLYVNPADLGQTGGDAYRFYGGHRLWHAPEDPTRTYQPDNEPVIVRESDGKLVFTNSAEARTGIQKRLSIAIGNVSQYGITVQHEVINRNLWDIDMAAWAITQLRAGGTAVMPLPVRGPHGPLNLLPKTWLALWAYTDLSDPRWLFGREYLLLRQDATRPDPQKIGFSGVPPWLAYINDSVMFAKQFGFGGFFDKAKLAKMQHDQPGTTNQAEVFTDDNLLELESLSPIQNVQRGLGITHFEYWSLHQDVPTPHNDDDVKQHILPVIAKMDGLRE